MMQFFLRNERGAAAIEFSLVAPLLVAVLISVVTLGGQVLAYNKMGQAVGSGAQYVMTHGGDDPAAVRDVVLLGWPGMPDDAEVNVVRACSCGAETNDCSTNCDDGSYPKKVTTITASMTYVGLGGNSRGLSARQEVRTW